MRPARLPKHSQGMAIALRYTAQLPLRHCKSGQCLPKSCKVRRQNLAESKRILAEIGPTPIEIGPKSGQLRGAGTISATIGHCCAQSAEVGRSYIGKCCASVWPHTLCCSKTFNLKNRKFGVRHRLNQKLYFRLYDSPKSLCQE